MAMSGGTDDGRPMIEMNMTPLIDVMLVLLIMFIITIPPITHAVKIDLPVNADVPENIEVDPVVNEVTISSNAVISWNGEPVTLGQLRTLLTETTAMEPEPELQFAPSPTAPYERVNEVLAVVKGSAINKFGFVGNENYANFERSPLEYQ